MAKNSVLIITGMHRSGTSLVASIMQEAGVSIGRELIGASKGNCRGHFEDTEFVHFQQGVMARSNATILIRDLNELISPSEEDRQQAMAILAERQRLTLWGWKDPRTTLFLRFWDDLLPDARYLFVFRHPLETALSLVRRGVDLESLVSPLVGLRAWYVYNREILRFFREYPERCFLASIDAVTANIDESVRQVGKKLDIPLELTDSEPIYYPDELLAVPTSEEMTSALTLLAPEAMHLYAQLLDSSDLGSVPPPVADSATVDELRTLDQMIAHVDQNRTLSASDISTFFTCILNAVAPGPMAGFGERLSRVAADHTQHVEDLRMAIVKSKEAEDWHAEQSANWQRTAEAQAAEIEDLRTWIVKLEESEDWHAEQSANWQRAAEAQAAEIEDLRTWIVKLKEAVDWHAEQSANWQRAAEAQAAEIEALSACIAQLKQSDSSLAEEKRTRRTRSLHSVLLEELKRLNAIATKHLQRRP